MEVKKQIPGIRSDRVPEELWTEVHDIVQEAVNKNIPKKKKCKKPKWWSVEALQIAEKRREAKEKEKKKDISFECRVPKIIKERKESVPQPSMQITGK